MRNDDATRFVGVEFHRFKAFRKFNLSLQHFNTHGKPRLHMFCPEERIPREIFWAGFGFQVWCQMLTHIVQSRDTALFLIDEPDIYLHSELQRQLIELLRDMGPDILIATHSTEIITEAVHIHHRKEIENFVLVPTAIDRAAERKTADQARRSGKVGRPKFEPFAAEFLDDFAHQKKAYVQAQYLTARRSFERHRSSGVNEATFSEAIITEFEELWASPENRLAVIPGKDALSAMNAHLQDQFGINLTATSIVDAMAVHEMPVEMKLLLADLGLFASSRVTVESDD